MDRILKLCRETVNIETGGVLVGHYTKRHDWAIVTDLSGPPIDSKQGRAFFNRGCKGLQTWLNQIWAAKRHYYIGEWHYHPFSRPAASAVDARQLKDHSENGSLICPEPVMLIVGGDPNGSWEANAYVYPKGKSLLLMNEITPTESTGKGQRGLANQS